MFSVVFGRNAPFNENNITWIDVEVEFEPAMILIIA